MSTADANAPDFRNQALAALRRGDAAVARDMLNRLVEAGGGDAVAFALLGEAWRRLGDAVRSGRLFRKSLTLDPNQADVWVALAEILAAARDDAGASQALERAAGLRPNDARPRLMLATLFMRQGRHEAAIAAIRAAVAADPLLGEMLNNLGVALDALGRRDQAVAALETAAILSPRVPSIQDNLGNAQLGIARAVEAEASHRRALALGSKSANTWNNLGNALHRQGRLEESEVCYRRAIAMAPATPKFHTNLALTLMLAGRYEEGLREYEWRWRDHPNLPVHLRDKPWDGTPMPGGTLLLQAEQGYGDTIQFVRLVPALRERVGRVILIVQPELMRLMAGVPGVDAVIPEGGTLPVFDKALTLMSLPGLPGIGWDPRPGSVPYLSVPKGAGFGLPAGEGMKVGIVWAGRPTHGDDRNRSIPAAMLAPILDVPGVRFVSLQRGAVAAHLGRPPADKVQEIADACADFADTAAIIAQLDLVIAVDTAIVHLAGALGRPVWAMLPPVPDFRWGMTGTASPWYPSLRLYRRSFGQGWEAVVARIVADLAQYRTSAGC